MTLGFPLPIAPIEKDELLEWAQELTSALELKINDGSLKETNSSEITTTTIVDANGRTLVDTNGTYAYSELAEASGAGPIAPNSISIDTAQLKTDAVTNTGSDFTASSQVTTTIATVVHTSESGKIFIYGSATLVDTGTTLTLVLKRDAITLLTLVETGHTIGNARNISFNFVDQPAAATYTYTLEQTATGTATNTGLNLLEIKR